MSDRELWDALSVIARRMGLIERGQRVTVEGDPREDVIATGVTTPSLCLAFGMYRDVRLCCTYAVGHEAPKNHSWELGMIGKSACIAVAAQLSFGADVVTCERPSGHTGEHAAAGADGVHWTWSDAPNPNVPSRGDAALMVAYAGAKVRESRKGCGAWEWGTNGHKAGCMLSAGHEGAHRGLDADGKSIFTWPCPCWPDCTGHAVPGVPDVKRAALTPSGHLPCPRTVAAGVPCNRNAGHGGACGGRTAEDDPTPRAQ